jgi:hypothetical protein
MSDEHRASPAQITPMEAAAVCNVGENPGHARLWSLEDAQNSSFELTPSPLDGPSHLQIGIYEGQGSKSMGAEQIEFPMSEASPAWVGELRAPSQDEALSSLGPGGGGGLRVGLVAGVLIAALGLGWAGVSNPHRFLKPGPASTQVQQPALPDRAAPAVDQKTASGAPNSAQVSTPTGSDLGTNRLGSEPIPRADQRVVSPQHAVPSMAQKSIAMKSAAVPLPREKQARHTPTLDTRPKTIEGWTVRDVFGGTAVLQGPDGIRRVSVGDTVPGAGRIDSIVRWGRRWVVATSRGLITTD